MAKHESSVPHWVEGLGGEAVALERVPSSEWASLGAAVGETASELHLQELLAKHPSVLPLQQFGRVYSNAVCIGREVSTTAGPVDCLYVTDLARLIVVETKLAKNPQARREVVAQLIDYCLCFKDWTYDQIEAAARDFVGPGFTSLHQHVISSMGKGSDGALDARSFRNELERGVRSGDILALIVGDRIEERALRLAEHASKHPRYAFEIGVVELAFYRRPGTTKPLLVVPSTLEQTRIVHRTVVSVLPADAPVTVELQTSEPTVSGRSPKLASEEQFISLVRDESPESVPFVKEVLEELKRAAEGSDLFFLDPAGKSYSFKVAIGADTEARVLGLKDEGTLNLYLDYLERKGRADLVPGMREIAINNGLDLTAKGTRARLPLDAGNMSSARATVSDVVRFLIAHLA
jgi:hypothetical protein